VGSKEEKKTSVLGFYEVTVPEVDGIGVLTLAKRAFSPDELGRWTTPKQQYTSIDFGVGPPVGESICDMDVWPLPVILV
jgi:hypothetical protein